MIVITGNGMGNRIFAWNLGNIISNNTLAITVIPKQNTPRYLWLYEIYIYVYYRGLFRFKLRLMNLAIIFFFELIIFELMDGQWVKQNFNRGFNLHQCSSFKYNLCGSHKLRFFSFLISDYIILFLFERERERGGRGNWNE